MTKKDPDLTTFTCPICQKGVQRGSKGFPFCSDRCQIIDLGHWSDGSYSIPDTSDPFLDPSDNSTLH